MADEFTWVLTEIQTRVKDLLGEQSLDDTISAKWINDYYTNHFPTDVNLDLINSIFTQETSPTDSGEYTLDQRDITLKKPITVDGGEIVFLGAEDFFRMYPRYVQEQFVTSPALAVGSDDTAKVANSAFKYKIEDYTYPKAAAETAFEDLETVPQNKYGAFALKIDADGDITISEAEDNATGYATPRLAIAGLDYADVDSAYMGFVTVIETAAAGFVPGTTSLATGGTVTATYTNGLAEIRGDIDACCVYDGKLYVRPKAADVHLIQANSVYGPTALESADAPLDIAWGPMIALGAAIRYARERTQNFERADALEGSPQAPKVGTWYWYKYKLTGKELMQNTQREIERSF